MTGQRRISDDAIECRVGYYFNLPRVTHKVVCSGVVIGRVYDNGHIEIDDPPSAAPPVRASDDG